MTQPMMQPVQNFTRSLFTSPEMIKPAFDIETPDFSKLFDISLLKRKIDKNSPSSFVVREAYENRSIEEQIFMSLAEAKIWTSRVSMHLEKNTRDRIFKQLDVLHDLDEWSIGDHPLSVNSYKSLVRSIIYHNINKKPSLALMPDGNVLCLWIDGQDKLTIEFLSENRTRWLIQSSASGSAERAAGTTSIERLRDILAPYGAERWFDAS